MSWSQLLYIRVCTPRGRLYMLVAKTKIFWTIPEPKNFYFWRQEVNTSMHFLGFNKEFVKSLILIYMCGILFFFTKDNPPQRSGEEFRIMYFLWWTGWGHYSVIHCTLLKSLKIIPKSETLLAKTDQWSANFSTYSFFLRKDLSTLFFDSIKQVNHHSQRKAYLRTGRPSSLCDQSHSCNVRIIQAGLRRS